MKMSNHSVSLIVILTCLISANNYVGADESDADSITKIGPGVGNNLNDAESLTKIGQGVGHTMNIYYCYSCGYRKVFEDYSGIINQKYPEISIVGSNYDPPGMNMYLSRIIGFGKMILIMCILSGVNIFAWLNKPQPGWWSWCLENKLYACMMMFFLANTIEGQLVSSGAFEISLDSIPLWSKLETGRIPQPPELFQIIDNTLHFSKMDMPTNNYVQ